MLKSQYLTQKAGFAIMPENIAGLRNQLLSHPMYTSIRTLPALHVYMQHHVFAVWDFMSLLKRLQHDLTGLSIPWVPHGQPHYVRFINEIVLGEESDEDGLGGYLSHFELYREAMAECGADVAPISAFLTKIQDGIRPLEALHQVNVPASVYNFVATSLDLAEFGTTFEVSSAFFYGREDIIPDMFRTIIQELSLKAKMDRFLYYLNRHIEVDSNQHGPWAHQLLTQLIGDDQDRALAAERAAIRALKSRIALWDGVWQEVSHKIPS